VYLSDGHRFPSWQQWSQRDGGWMDDVRWVAGDYNGDGKADVAAVWNNGGTNTLTVRQSTGTAFVPSHWATNAGGWSNTAAWCSGVFPAPQGATELKKDHSGLSDLSKPVPPIALGRVATTGPVPSLCDAARSARARNSPAAPSLERQCTASGGSFAPLPADDTSTVERLASVGARIATDDPAVAAARAGVASAEYRHGFDVGTGLFGDPAHGAQGNTLMGPGSARIRDSLSVEGRHGFNDAVAYHTARDYHPAK
jgi:hypothetical protein